MRGKSVSLTGALCGVVALVVAGCSDPAEDDAGKAASDALSAAGSAVVHTKISLSASIAGVGGNSSIEGTTHRRFGADPAADTNFISFPSTDFSASSTGTGAAPVPKAHVPPQIVEVGGVSYLHSYGPGKPWRKLDELYQRSVSNPAAAMKGPDLTTGTSALLDPNTYLHLATQAAAHGQKPTKSKDSDAKDAKPGDRYQVNCWTSPEPTCDAATLGPITASFPDLQNPVEMDLWLDDDHRPTEIDATYTLQHGDDFINVTSTMTIDGFGEQHAFDPPPPDQTYSCRDAGSGRIACS